MEQERASDWDGATPVGMGGAAGPEVGPAGDEGGRPAPRLNLFAAVEPSEAPAVPQPTPQPVAAQPAPAQPAPAAEAPAAEAHGGVHGDELLSRFDEIGRLLVRRDATQASATASRLGTIEESLNALNNRFDAEVTTIREAWQTRIDEVEADAARAVTEAETRFAGMLQMQNEVIEAIMTEKERSDAALVLLQDGLTAQVTEGAAQAQALGERLARIERRGDDALVAALGTCSIRLDEALLHMEAAAVDALPSGGRPMKSAIQGLADQIAAMQAEMRALSGRSAGEPPEDARAAV